MLIGAEVEILWLQYSLHSLMTHRILTARGQGQGAVLLFSLLLCYTRE